MKISKRLIGQTVRVEKLDLLDRPSEIYYIKVTGADASSKSITGKYFRQLASNDNLLLRIGTVFCGEYCVIEPTTDDEYKSELLNCINKYV